MNELPPTLLARFRRGDTDAFTDVVRRFDGRLLALAARLGNGAQDPQDLRQQAWVRAFRSRATFAERGDLEAWLYRIVLHLVRDEGRRTTRTERAREAWGQQQRRRTPPAEPRQLLETEETRRAVADAVHALPADERECVVLRHYHGCSMARIAEILGRPPSTVQSCWTRAMNRLAERLAPRSEIAS